ncbi:MAG: F0F1 ATP synthase subunit B, partial [Deltaproteobacteria bacterium]|nr:F0F1 ATP synthase subunit B [Deltaproteobacteria bacterium]
IAEIRTHAVDLALQAAQRLIESSLDEARQRQLVTDFISKIDSRKPSA